MYHRSFGVDPAASGDIDRIGTIGTISTQVYGLLRGARTYCRGYETFAGHVADDQVTVCEPVFLLVMLNIS